MPRPPPMGNARIATVVWNLCARVYTFQCVTSGYLDGVPTTFLVFFGISIALPYVLYYSRQCFAVCSFKFFKDVSCKQVITVFAVASPPPQADRFFDLSSARCGKG